MEMMQMSILVAYASKHGATKELAERISENLRNAGLQADARVVGDVGDLGSYERVVVGSAAHMDHWMKDAVSLPVARAIMPEGDFRDGMRSSCGLRGLPSRWRRWALPETARQGTSCRAAASIQSIAMAVTS